MSGRSAGSSHGYAGRMPEPRTFRDEPVSFVRRSGRMSEAQERAFAELAPLYLLDVPRDVAWTSVHPEARLDAVAAYGRSAPLVVEVGSGQGHAIVAAAGANPANDFLAVEVFRAGLARTMLDADRAGVRNLRLVEANAPEVLSSFLPPAAADEVWIFFPDPWHKKKHNKRRLIQPGFVQRLAGRIAPGGYLHCATDWQPYAEQMLEVLSAEPLLRNTAEGYAPKPDYRPLTKFENRGLKLGHGVWDLVFSRPR